MALSPTSDWCASTRTRGALKENRQHPVNTSYATPTGCDLRHTGRLRQRSTSPMAWRSGRARYALDLPECYARHSGGTARRRRHRSHRGMPPERPPGRAVDGTPHEPSMQDLWSAATSRSLTATRECRTKTTDDRGQASSPARDDDSGDDNADDNRATAARCDAGLRY
jgi:hypothetical protein